jgi:hypothetical protein
MRDFLRANADEKSTEYCFSSFLSIEGARET